MNEFEVTKNRKGKGTTIIMLEINCPNQSTVIVNAFKPRKITHAFHDIDGTHSLIRQWMPVMSILLNETISQGLYEGFDSDSNLYRIVSLAGKQPLPETDMFCVVSAGLSALTQMEWALRRAAENGKLDIPFDKKINSEIIKQIYAGKEEFAELGESPEFIEYIKNSTPKLFKFYENVLNKYCRDRNLMRAKSEPSEFIVPGSMKFMSFLHENGVKNYFITGAVVEKGMGMHEEVITLGYDIGEGKLVEDILGSTWTEKKPKNRVMNELIEAFGIKGENVLVVGDGRSEIEAGVNLGGITVSRLDSMSTEQRDMHRSLGTNVIISDYTDPELYSIFIGVDCQSSY